ncbi:MULTISPECIES: hypothetical protein [Burkholderia cepacia complex]|uniref:hypothetical protein n=1 Tax=Burkholderia cepacia complex TaxID=87882 RepID=UPI001B937DAC|nr:MULTISPECIES: hypothetical protein [Burkholderia cepacia complex]MBR8409007.1 hypothetical protein [Burkholderia cenocepacia]WJN72872.1 hypothetical protein OH687_21445 [Burkholderia anthina]
MLSSVPVWQDAVKPHLAAWDVDVDTVSSPDGVPAGCDVVVFFGHLQTWHVADEAALPRRVPWTIDVSAEGPRAPVVSGRRISVSCYAISGLRAALACAFGQTDLRIAAPSTCVPRDESVRVRLLAIEDHP